MLMFENILLKNLIHFPTSPFHTLQFGICNLPYNIAVLCVNIAVIIHVFCIEADIAVSILNQYYHCDTCQSTRNNYKVTAETIFLSIVPVTQSVKGCCKLHST